MERILKNVRKKEVETYELKFNTGEIQEFTIDLNEWNFFSAGPFGDYVYRGWSPEKNRSFKEFLSKGLAADYLLSKMSSEGFFDYGESLEKFKEGIKERLECEDITKDEHATLLEWFYYDFQFESKIDSAQQRFIDCPHTNSVLNNDNWIYMIPEGVYYPADVSFFKTIFREFQKVLSEELSNDAKRRFCN